ncbi:MAG: hypothetical protein ACLFP8_00055 [Alphaproteobacteria bacterium]
MSGLSFSGGSAMAGEAACDDMPFAQDLLMLAQAAVEFSAVPADTFWVAENGDEAGVALERVQEAVGKIGAIADRFDQAGDPFSLSGLFPPFAGKLKRAPLSYSRAILLMRAVDYQHAYVDYIARGFGVNIDEPVDEVRLARAPKNDIYRLWVRADRLVDQMYGHLCKNLSPTDEKQFRAHRESYHKTARPGRVLFEVTHLKQGQTVKGDAEVPASALECA